jgi:hypothetical protein
MYIRIATAAAFALTITSPALANCKQELKMLEPNIVTAETGASTMPATKHQEQVITGKQESGAPETTGSTTQMVDPASPHQEQVTGERGASSAKPSQMMAEARKMADAGDEQGCMNKLAELKDMLGVK